MCTASLEEATALGKNQDPRAAEQDVAEGCGQACGLSC